MAAEPARSVRRIYSAHGDPIRIVPLHTTEAAQTPTTEVAALAPTAAPELTYRSGPLLTHVEVFTIFWGRPGRRHKRPWRISSTSSSISL